MTEHTDTQGEAVAQGSPGLTTEKLDALLVHELLALMESLAYIAKMTVTVVRDGRPKAAPSKTAQVKADLMRVACDLRSVADALERRGQAEMARAARDRAAEIDATEP